MSDAAMKRRGHWSGYPILLDDVEISKEIQKKIIDGYTGCGEVDAKAEYTVRSGMMLASNSAPVVEDTR